MLLELSEKGMELYMGQNNYDLKGYIAKYQRIPYYPVAFEKGIGALLYDYNGKDRKSVV